jgi:hypothetical protein
LQNERCGDLIDQRFVLLAGFAGGVEDFVGFAGGEPFVPKIERQTGQLGQFGGEGLDFGGLCARFAGQMQRIAGDNPCAAEFAAEAGERAEVVAGVALAGEREDGLRGEAELVRDGDADALRADVEAEIAGWGRQLPAPGF